MNSLSGIKAFEAYKESTLGRDLSVLSDPALTEKYVVPTHLYDFYGNIFKGYKSPLAKHVVKQSQRGAIALVNYAEPLEVTSRTPVFNVHYLTSFITKSGGKLVSYSNIASKAGYNRNKFTNEIEDLKIAERELYAFLELAATNLLFSTKTASFEGSTKFPKLVAELYSTMLARCVNKTFPISAERDKMIVLNFLAALFCLQVMFGFDQQKSVDTALTLRNVEKDVVKFTCRGYLAKDDTLAMANIADFIRCFEHEFDFIKKGSLGEAALLQMYTKMYGSRAIFAVEHFFSFWTMILMGNHRIGLYNDLFVDGMAKNYLKDLLIIMASVVDAT
jgi:hypothetical protein